MRRNQQGKGGRAPRGYVSYMLVVTTSITLLVMMISQFRSAITAHRTQGERVVKIDYAEKEEAILRALVSLVPNRAIRAMQHNSNQPDVRLQLQWRQIFLEALQQANASESVAADVLEAFGKDEAIHANPGDAPFAMNNIASLIDPIEPDPHSMHVSPSVGRLISGGVGYPPPLNTSNATDRSRDALYPLISNTKQYAARAQARVGAPVGTYPLFNQLSYPDVRFGYGEPGRPFVAKQNWWAFSIGMSEIHKHLTGIENTERDFVFSIYEVPSQLPISVEAHAQLGLHADGTPWQDVSIDGGVFATRAQVSDNITLERISGRRGLSISPAATVGAALAGDDPFLPGNREAFEIANGGAFFPISLASEAGRAAFIPINRGREFFDRFASSAETNTVSSTTWNDYSVGARQCAMRLDISDVVSSIDPRPTELRFSYLAGSVRREISIPQEGYPVEGALPAGFTYCATEGENDVVVFESPVDVAYGADGRFGYLYGVVGEVKFSEATFGDPSPGVQKKGYFRPSPPFERKLHGERWCVAFYPQRVEAFLSALGASGPATNHSVAINLDYVNNAEINPLWVEDYGVLLEECADLQAFTRGFSLVTNFRTYIGDHLNIMSIPAPAAGIPTPHYPPLSLFSPEVRYGINYAPTHITHRGQRGSLAGESAADAAQVHLLDIKNGFDVEVSHDRLTVNLSGMTHPAALPPVTAMNWLITVEERKEAYLPP